MWCLPVVRIRDLILIDIRIGTCCQVDMIQCQIEVNGIGRRIDIRIALLPLSSSPASDQIMLPPDAVLKTGVTSFCCKWFAWLNKV